MPAESRADVSVHGFWKWDTSALFYIQISNLDADFYLQQTYVKYMETVEKENKDKYIQPCTDLRRTFTPMLYSTDIIMGV